MHSDTFKEALAAHNSAGPFVLPRITGQQAVLLLQMLYAACDAPAWVDATSFAERSNWPSSAMHWFAQSCLE